VGLGSGVGSETGPGSSSEPMPGSGKELPRSAGCNSVGVDLGGESGSKGSVPEGGLSSGPE
jgi:hypothetical protein